MVHSASLSAFLCINALFLYFSKVFFKELPPSNTETSSLLKKGRSRMTEGTEKISNSQELNKIQLMEKEKYMSDNPQWWKRQQIS